MRKFKNNNIHVYNASSHRSLAVLGFSFNRSAMPDHDASQVPSYRNVSYTLGPSTQASSSRVEERAIALLILDYACTESGLRKPGRDSVACALRRFAPEYTLSLLTLARSSTRASDLIAHAVVLALHALHLLLEVLHVAVFGSELFLESTNFTSTANVLERLATLDIWVALHGLDLLLEAENIKDHDVGSVQDEGEEESEAAQVHVALRVELAGLYLHALDATEAVGTEYDKHNVSMDLLANLPATLLVAHSRQLDLNAVDAVYAVNE